MMVRFRFGRETSSTVVGGTSKASVRVMEPPSLSKTGTGLAPGAIGICTLPFAFGRGAEPPGFPTTEFAVFTPDETPVPSPGDTDDRPDPIEDPSANGAVNSDEASKFRGDVDV